MANNNSDGKEPPKVLDAYKIGVEIMVASNYSKVLGPLSKALLGTRLEVDKLKGSIGGLNTALAGSGAVAAIDGVTRLGAALAKAGAQVSDVRAKMVALGMTPATVDANMRAAQQASELVAGTTYAGNAQALIELRSVLENSEQARAALPAYLTAQRDLDIFRQKHPSADAHASDILPALKAADVAGAFVNKQTGKLDPALLEHAIQAAEAAIELTNGTMSASELMRTVRLAGPAAMKMDFTAFLKDLVEAIQGIGPSAGRGLQYGAKTLLGGTVTKAEVEQLKALGLLHDGDVKNDHGHYSIIPGRLKGYDELLHKGMVSWFHDIVEPILKEQNSSVLQSLSAFPATMQRVLSFIETNYPQIDKFGRQFDQRMGTDANAALMDNSVIANTQALAGAFTSLEQVLGEPLVKPAIIGLKGLTAGILDLEDVAAKHPDIARIGELTTLAGALAGGTYLSVRVLRAFNGLLRTLAGGQAEAAAKGLSGIATGVGDIAGVTGLATMGAALTGIAGGLTALFGVLKLGSAYETPETQQHLRELGKAMRAPPVSQLPLRDGFDEEGRPIHKQTYHPPMASAHVLQIKLDEPLTVDGRVLTRLVSEGQARYMTLPPSGTSRFDTRMSPLAPGQQIDI